MRSPEEQETFETYRKSEIARVIVENSYTSDFRYPEVLDFLTLIPGGLILDIGCGGAPYALLFEKEQYAYIGIDWSEAMLHEARKYTPHAHCACMDISMLALRPRCADGFLALWSLYHIPKSKIASVLQEIQNVVKQGGFGLILMPKAEEGKKEEMMVTSEDCKNGERVLVTLYGRDEFLHLLEDNGFEVLDCSEDPPRKYYTYWYIFTVRIQ